MWTQVYEKLIVSLYLIFTVKQAGLDSYVIFPQNPSKYMPKIYKSGQKSLLLHLYILPNMCTCKI